MVIEDSPLVLLSDGVPPFVMGGMQKHSKLLAENLAMNGIPVVLYHYCFDGEKGISNEQVLDGFDPNSRPFLTVRTFEYPPEDVFPGHYLRGQKRMAKAYLKRLALEQFSPMMIYAKGFMAYDVDAVRNLFPSVPVAVKFHGMNMFQTQPNLKGEFTKYLFRSRVRRIMNKADIVFSYGGKISDVIRHEITDPNKIIEFPSGIEEGWIAHESRAGTSAGSRKFLFVGRLDRLKGLPELMDVMQHHKEMSMSLSIVGPIPATQLPSDKRICLVGPVSDAEKLMRIYDEHDVLICPSISEGMPNVILEAMARGLPVIATDVGASSILVDETTGWLIKPMNKQDLVNAMKAAISDSELSEKGERCILKVRNQFNWKIIASEMAGWLREFSSK